MYLNIAMLPWVRLENASTAILPWMSGLCIVYNVSMGETGLCI